MPHKKLNIVAFETARFLEINEGKDLKTFIAKDDRINISSSMLKGDILVIPYGARGYLKHKKNLDFTSIDIIGSIPYFLIKYLNDYIQKLKTSKANTEYVDMLSRSLENYTNLVLEKNIYPHLFELSNGQINGIDGFKKLFLDTNLIHDIGVDLFVSIRILYDFLLNNKNIKSGILNDLFKIERNTITIIYDELASTTKSKELFYKLPDGLLVANSLVNKTQELFISKTSKINLPPPPLRIWECSLMRKEINETILFSLNHAVNYQNTITSF